MPSSNGWDVREAAAIPESRMGAMNPVAQPSSAASSGGVPPLDGSVSETLAEPAGATPALRCDSSGSAKGQRLSSRAAAAFTLLEVVLAVFIATGILVAALHFYNQAANLRTQLLAETERIATVRLIMDRITADLRSARSDFESGHGLHGDATSLSLLRAGLLPASAWAGAASERGVLPHSDVRVVTYRAQMALEDTNQVVIGLLRTERPFAEPREVSEKPRRRESNSETNAPASAAEPLTDVIRHVRFRYYDGAEWQNTWVFPELPVGVEVTLGCETLPDLEREEEFPTEVYRRTIFLPGSGVVDTSLSWFDLFEEPSSPSSAAP